MPAPVNSRRQTLAHRALEAMRDGRPQEALDALGEACGLEGGHRPAFEALIAEAQAMDGLPLAERLMLDWALGQRHSAVRRDLAALFRANARWEHLEALNAPLAPDQLRAIALRRYAAGEYGLARKLLRSYAERAEPDSEVLRHLGLLAEDSAEMAQAEAYYRQAQAREAQAGAATRELGAYYWRHGRDAEARPWLEAAHRALPGDLELSGLLASALAGCGETAGLTALFFETLQAGAPWDTRLVAAAAELQAEPIVFSALYEALGLFAPDWRAPLAQRARGEGRPAGAPEPWEALITLPEARRLSIGLVLPGNPREPATFAAALDNLGPGAHDVVAIAPELSGANRAVAEARGVVVVTGATGNRFADIKRAAREAQGDWFMYATLGDRLPPGGARLLRRLVQRVPLNARERFFLVGQVVHLQPNGEIANLYRRVMIGPRDPRIVRVLDVSSRHVFLEDSAAPPLANRVVTLPHLQVHHHGGRLTEESPARAEALRAKLEANPDDPVLLWHAGYHAQAAGDRDAAGEFIARALAQFEARGEGRGAMAQAAHVTLASLRLRAEDLPGTLAACGDGLATFPSDPDLNAMRGLALLLTGHASEAIAPLERALSMAGWDGTSVSYKPYTGWLGELLLALAHWICGHPAYCRTRLRQARAGCASRAAFDEHLAAFCTALGRPEAVAELRRQAEPAVAAGG